MKRSRVEPGIYRQVNGTYAVYYLLNGKPRFKTIGPKLAEARRARTQLLAKAERGELATPTRLTFTQLAASWLDSYAALVASGERSPRTIENYRYYLDKHLLPAFGRKRIQEISTDDIAGLIVEMRAKGYAAKTINNMLAPLGRILSHALRRDYITDNPLGRLEHHERPRIEKRNQRVLNHQQISALLHASLPRYRSLLATAIYTGLRLNELLGLTWQDVDLIEGFVHVRYQLSRPTLIDPAHRVRLKTAAATRDIPLLLQLASVLKRHKLAAPHSAAGDYVFATATGTPLGARNVERRGLGYAADQAGLNGEDVLRLRVHDLRHTFASHLIIDLKLDIAHVSRILGHARPSITLDTYTHLYNQAQHADDIRARMATSQFAAALTTPTSKNR